MKQSFDRYGAAIPDSPVVLSVPHAGRDYPPELRAALRAPLRALVALEDRHVDEVALAARGEETLLVQRLPRAWIDLNRAEHERDPRLDDGAASGHLTAKVRSGLGIVPRRTTLAGDLWRRRLGAEEVDRRIACDHRPYHAALGVALAAARARFGTAVLLDVHSMPPLPGSRRGIVVGDRFGKAAEARFVHRIEAEIAPFGIGLALNAPYPGGHILERHASPVSRIHGIQLEFDRTLYLDRSLENVGIGFGETVAMLRGVIDALADEALSAPTALAAE
jgi:N-formylglutamate amidohydrolase